MTNIQDWCISRQLWWGHRIPAWYCDRAATITVARDGADGVRDVRRHGCARTTTSSTPGSRRRCGRSRRSAGPTRRATLATFYPNNVLVTGPDIIFFWVARMMMMGLHFMGKVPFRTVYLTSIVTDENGDKMSKTKGNVIDPLDVVHGATLEALLERVDVEKPPDPEAVKKAIKKNFAEGHPADGRRRAAVRARGAQHRRLATSGCRSIASRATATSSTSCGTRRGSR